MTVTTELCRARDIAAGWYTSYVIDDSGRVFAFGLDNYGQATAEPARLDAENDEVLHFPACLQFIQACT